jgi:hypothetical protein
MEKLSLFIDFIECYTATIPDYGRRLHTPFYTNKLIIKTRYEKD